MRYSATVVLGAACSFLVVAATAVATAPQAAAPRIAIINGERVLAESSIGLSARERIESTATNWQEQINTLRAEADALNQQRQEQALTLNEVALARLNDQIEEKQVQLERMQDDARRELTRLEQQLTQDVNSRLGPLVDQLARREGYDLILDSSRASGLLFFSQAIDITDEFLALVNAD